MCCTYLLEASSFLTKYRKGADPEGRGGGRDLGEEEGGEMTIRIYCMRKESIFSKRGKKKGNSCLCPNPCMILLLSVP